MIHVKLLCTVTYIRTIVLLYILNYTHRHIQYMQKVSYINPSHCIHTSSTVQNHTQLSIHIKHSYIPLFKWEMYEYIHNSILQYTCPKMFHAFLYTYFTLYDPPKYLPTCTPTYIRTHKHVYT